MKVEHVISGRQLPRTLSVSHGDFDRFGRSTFAALGLARIRQVVSRCVLLDLMTILGR